MPVKNILHSLNFKMLSINSFHRMSLFNRSKLAFLDNKSKDIPVVPQETIFSIPVSPDVNFLSN